MTTRREFLVRSTAALAGAMAITTVRAAQGSPATGHARVGQGARRVRPVPTATGEIMPDQMGIASLHEHIAVRHDSAERDQSVAFAIRELNRAKQLGLRTIVDVGPADDVAAIREVALATGINVVCCTGFYLQPALQQSLNAEDFESKMLRDIEHGLQETEVRPGVIKVAARGLPIRPVEKELFTAAARVQRKYHLPICAHAVSGCAEQQQILEAAGADLRRCYFSHVEATFGWGGRTVDAEIDYLEGVVGKGSTLSFNNFGHWFHTKPQDLVCIIQELARRSHEDRMVATMDVTWSFADEKLKLLWEDQNEHGKDRTYAYLLETALPWLQANGIPQAITDKFVIDNPRRIFTHVEP